MKGINHVYETPPSKSLSTDIEKGKCEDTWDISTLIEGLFALYFQSALLLPLPTID